MMDDKRTRQVFEKMLTVMKNIEWCALDKENQDDLRSIRQEIKVLIEAKFITTKIEFELPNKSNIVNDLHEALCELTADGAETKEALGFLRENVFNIVHPAHQE